jgi:glycosyltransferase involved in cell wall biosynthesis
MTEAMLRLITDRELRKSLGENARRGAADLTVDAAANRLAGLYESLHAARHASGARAQATA